VQIALAAIKNTVDLYDSALLSTQPDCELSGPADSLTLIDNDGDFLPGAGDVVEQIYDGCRQEVLGDPAAGRMDVTVNAFTVTPALTVSGDLTIDIPEWLAFSSDTGAAVLTAGQLVAAFSKDGAGEQLTVTTRPGASYVVRLTVGGETFLETITNVNISRNRDAVGGYQVSASFDLDSSLLGFTMACATTAAFSGGPDLFPDSGTLQCTAADSSAARLSPNSAGGIQNTVDPEGDGTFVDAGLLPETSGNWTEIFEGPVFFATTESPENYYEFNVPRLTPSLRDIDVNDAFYDAAGDKLYVTTDTELLVIDPDTLDTLDSVGLAGTPAPVTASDDGQVIWVGFDTLSEVASFDASDLSETGRYTLPIDPDFSFNRFARFMRTAPGLPGRLVISTRNSADTLVLENGVFLADELSGADNAPSRFEFRDANTIIGVNSDTSFYPAILARIDASGITADKSIRELAGGFGRHIDVAGGKIWSNAGTVGDIDSETRIGKVDYDLPGIFVFADGVVVNETEGRAYFINVFDGLQIYDPDTLLARGGYAFNSLGTGRLVDFFDSGDALLAVTDLRIARFDKASFTDNVANLDCATQDLGGQLGPQVYIEIDCELNDAVYDAGRDLLYATVPSVAGGDGNSLAFIDPRTGTIQKFLFLGSEPDDLALSANGTYLYVVLSESSTLAVVNLQTQALEEILPLGLDDLSGNPRIPELVAAADNTDATFAVVSNSGTSVWSSGTRLAMEDTRRLSLEAELYFLQNDQKLLTAERRDLVFYDVTANGLENRSEARNTDYLGRGKKKGSLLYDALRNVFDPATLQVVATCPTSNVSGVEPDPDSDDIYYFVPGFDSQVVVCDQATETVGTPFDIPRNGEPVSLKTMVKAGIDRLALIAVGKTVLLDPGEF
jgi:DNA-binding beta-propeller fold protein YncE